MGNDGKRYTLHTVSDKEENETALSAVNTPRTPPTSSKMKRLAKPLANAVLDANTGKLSDGNFGPYLHEANLAVENNKTAGKVSIDWRSRTFVTRSIPTNASSPALSRTSS
jgi:hypothetical protein